MAHAPVGPINAILRSLIMSAVSGLVKDTIWYGNISTTKNLSSCHPDESSALLLDRDVFMRGGTYWAYAV